MYIVTIQNGETFTEIHGDTEKLLSGKVVKGINVIDSFSATLHPSNAGFGKLLDYVTLVNIFNTNKNRYEFYGRVLYSGDEMTTEGAIRKNVICESYLGFFCDSTQTYIAERTWTRETLLKHIVSVHNSLVDDYKHFTVGKIDNPNDTVTVGISRKNSWETINEALLNTLGGEIRLRVENGVNYIDYLEKIGTVSSTPIALSHNMQSIVRERNPAEIVTRLIPYGAKIVKTVIDGEGNTTEETTEERRDISSVNGGRIYIDDTEAKAKYGIRVGMVEFDDITKPAEIKAAGEKWLRENNRVRVSYKIGVLDLSLLGIDLDDLDVGNTHRVENSLLNMDEYARIIKKTVDIPDDVKSTVEFGDNLTKLSDLQEQQKQAVKALSGGYVTQTVFSNTTSATNAKISATEKNLAAEIEALKAQISGHSSARVSEVTIYADRWIGDVSPYSQVVDVAGATENTQVDLTPSVEQLAIFHNKDLAFVTENDGGIVTVYAIGDKPLNDYIIQVTLTEVNI